MPKSKLEKAANRYQQACKKLQEIRSRSLSGQQHFYEQLTVALRQLEAVLDHMASYQQSGNPCEPVSLKEPADDNFTSPGTLESAQEQDEVVENEFTVDDYEASINQLALMKDKLEVSLQNKASWLETLREDLSSKDVYLNQSLQMTATIETIEQSLSALRQAIGHHYLYPEQIDAVAAALSDLEVALIDAKRIPTTDIRFYGKPLEGLLAAQEYFNTILMENFMTNENGGLGADWVRQHFEPALTLLKTGKKMASQRETEYDFKRFLACIGLQKELEERVPSALAVINAVFSVCIESQKSNKQFYKQAETQMNTAHRILATEQQRVDQKREKKREKQAKKAERSQQQQQQKSAARFEKAAAEYVVVNASDLEESSQESAATSSPSAGNRLGFQAWSDDEFGVQASVQSWQADSATLFGRVISKASSVSDTAAASQQPRPIV